MVCNIGYMPWGNGYKTYGGGYSNLTMPFNFFRSPYLNYGCNSAGYNWATMMGIAAGNRDVLRISYECLLGSLNDLVQKTSSALSNNKLTSEQECQYRQLNAQANALLQKVQNFGRNSMNTMIFAATNTVHQFEKEYKNLYDAEVQLSQSVNASTSTTAATSSTTPSSATTQTTQTTDTTDTTQTTQTTDTTQTTSTTPTDGVENEETVEQIKQKYESELKNNLEEMIADPDITAEDKQKLQEKKQELEKAIEENKPIDEIKRIYNELTALMVDVASKIGLAKAERNIQELRNLINKSSELIRTIRQHNRDNQKYTDRADRTKLSEKMQELQEAIAANKTKDEIKKIYDELNSLFTQIKTNTSNLIAKADSICGAILNASDGVDWSWPWSGDTDNEKAIKNAVKKINKTNVRAVLNRWDDIYKASTGDSCLLETLYAEFKADSDSKATITQHISKAIELYAKSKEAFDKVSGYLQIISGNRSYNDKYNAFNKIIIELNKMA